VTLRDLELVASPFRAMESAAFGVRSLNNAVRCFAPFRLKKRLRLEWERTLLAAGSIAQKGDATKADANGGTWQQTSHTSQTARTRAKGTSVLP
jgi:hypothetical protein